MLWRMAGLSTASQVEAILDKENFSLEELLDESDIVQECKARNSRLISFLREKDQIKQLIKYIVEEAPEDSVKQRSLKFPFVAGEIFTCEVDIILNAVVGDEDLMDLLFSFLDRERPHSTVLAGHFSKVAVCLLARKTVPLMSYIRAHQDIISKLVDLIGITSIMEVLIRLIDVDEHVNANAVEPVKWLEDMSVLDMIVDKFSSSDSPEVHNNSAELLCTITRFAPPRLASKISSPSFVGKLFSHALQESRPKSVLVNLLSVCICILDPKKLSPSQSYMYGREMGHGSGIALNPETVQGMLERLGDFLQLLDHSSEDNILLTAYGKLQPPLGKHRLKIVEFIAVLVGVSSEAAEEELIRLGAVNQILNLFFEYPFNNFLHHHVEKIITSCLESNNPRLVGHLLHDCNLIDKIVQAERNSSLAVDANKSTLPAEGRSPPRTGNIGHLTRIANKLIQLGNTESPLIQEFLQGSSAWVDWQTNVLLKRNAVENVLQWACGRPTRLQDPTRDSDDDEDDDYQKRDFDVSASAENANQAIQSYNINDTNEDTIIDGKSADVVITSLRLGDEQQSASVITSSNLYQSEDRTNANEDTVERIEGRPKDDEIVEENLGSVELIITPASESACTLPEGIDGEALANDPSKEPFDSDDVNLRQSSTESDEGNHLSKVDSTIT